MVLGKVEKGISKTSSVQGSESAWLGRWTKLCNEVKLNGESNHSKDLIMPKDNAKERKSGDKVLPFPMFKVSQKRDISSTSKLQAYPVMETKPHFHESAGSSSKAMANRMPGMYAEGDNHQEKLLELIRPVDSVQRVDGEIKLSEENGHKLLKGSAVSMKLKGKIFGEYLDLFPKLDQGHIRGVKLQSLERSKNTEEDGPPRKHESSAETNTLEIDKFQTIDFSGSISSSLAKGKGRKGDSDILRIEIPDMNEEPPLVPNRENSVDRHQGETSNSATQCMNVDNFLTRGCKRVRLEPELELSSRWVKRLKTNASGSSGHDETKSLMKIEEASSLSQKVNKNIFLEILKSGINNLEPRNQKHATSQIKNQDITLLHPWIQRWCKKKEATSTDQTGVQEVRFEPENQKEFAKKQYPSIAAMALMGKALTGLNPYGLRKTDSLMVWNNRAM